MILSTAYNSGHTATLRSAQIPLRGLCLSPERCLRTRDFKVKV